MNTGGAVQPGAGEGAEQALEPARVLLVAEEATELAVLEAALTSERLRVQAVEAGELDRVFGKPFDVALVRSDAPSPFWQEVITRIKSRWGIPLVCLLPMPTTQQLPILAGLGADTFSFLPVRIQEVAAHIELWAWKARAEARRRDLIGQGRNAALFRSVPPARRPPTPVAEQVVVDDRQKRVKIGGRSIHLSPLLYKLLLLLASDPGRVFSVGEISACLWPRKRVQNAEVQQFVYLLRKRLEKEPRQPEWVLSEPGFGYRLNRPGQD